MVEKAVSKLCENPYKLKTGMPIDAAHGLLDCMCADHDFYNLLAMGVKGIQEEVSTHTCWFLLDQ